MILGSDTKRCCSNLVIVHKQRSDQWLYRERENKHIHSISIWIERKMKALLFEKRKRREKRIGCVVPPVCEVNVLCLCVHVCHNHNKTALNGSSLCWFLSANVVC